VPPSTSRSDFLLTTVSNITVVLRLFFHTAALRQRVAPRMSLCAKHES
jgi:hypothetical protein